jgi:hypothetical protein
MPEVHTADEALARELYFAMNPAVSPDSSLDDLIDGDQYRLIAEYVNDHYTRSYNMDQNYVAKIVQRLDEELPGNDPELIDLYVLLVMTKGVNTTLADVHEAWGIWKNRINPLHKSLIPFDSLTVEVQELDRKYMDGIHTVAREIYG